MPPPMDLLTNRRPQVVATPLPSIPTPLTTPHQIATAEPLEISNLGSKIYNSASSVGQSLLTGSSRLFGNVQQLLHRGSERLQAAYQAVEEQVNEIQNQASSAVSAMCHSLCEFFGVEEEQNPELQIRALGASQQSSHYEKQSNLSKTSLVQNGQERLVASAETDRPVFRTDSHSSNLIQAGTTEASPNANRDSAQGQQISSSSNSNLSSALQKEQGATSLTRTAQQQTDFNPIAQVATYTANTLSTPNRSISLLQSLTQYFQASTPASSSRHRTNEFRNFTTQISTSESRPLADTASPLTFAEISSDLITNFREQIRGARFFMHRSREEERHLAFDPTVFTRTTNQSLASNIETSSPSANVVTQSSALRTWKDNLFDFEGRLRQEASKSAELTQTLATQWAAQSSRINRSLVADTTLSQHVVDELNQEHTRVEASLSSLGAESQNHKQTASTEAIALLSQHESDVRNSNTNSQVAPAQLPHGDLQASVFTVA